MLLTMEKSSQRKFDQKIVWNMVASQVFLHIGFLVGLYYLLSGRCLVFTYFWAFLVFIVAGIGIGPAAHRLFSHRAYKVTFGLKVFMIFCQQLAGLASVFYWCRIHRTHHKFAETDRDPTDINRGLFYAYMEWMWLTHTPEVREEMDKIDMRDLLADKELQFQYKYYVVLFGVVTIIFPSIVPYIFWNESLWIAFWVNITRYVLNFMQQNVGNSFLHYNGKKPYDDRITAAESKMWIVFLLGEGHHNYHHVFPYDYRASEFGGITDWNFGAFFIDACAKFGWVHDRKFATPKMIERRVRKTGDGNHWLLKKEAFNEGIWGFGDENIDADDNYDLKNLQ